MGQYLKYLIQLLLSPTQGWADIAGKDPEPAALFRRGLFPLMVVVALTEFFGLLYNKGYSVETVLVRVVIDFGAYFVAYLLARVIFEMYSRRLAAARGILIPDGERAIPRRDSTVIVMALGLMLLIQLVCNCLQAKLTLLAFMPLYVVLVIYKSTAYVGARDEGEMTYMLVASLATVVVPIALEWLLSIILL